MSQHLYYGKENCSLKRQYGKEKCLLRRNITLSLGVPRLKIERYQTTLWKNYGIKSSVHGQRLFEWPHTSKFSFRFKKKINHLVQNNRELRSLKSDRDEEVVNVGRMPRRSLS